MKRRFIRFIAVLLIIFSGIGATKFCAADHHSISKNVKHKLETLYENYKLEKSRATNFFENFLASRKFCDEIANLRQHHRHVLRNFVKIFCKNDVPHHIKEYTIHHSTFIRLSIDHFSGKVLCKFESDKFLNRLVYLFEL